MSDGKRPCLGAMNAGVARMFMAVDMGWSQC